MAKLMKPLFVNGNYNREGKRIRAEFFKSIGKYDLWVGAGLPDKDHARNEKDKYYLYVQKDEWLVMTGLTEHQLEEKAGYEHLNREWYGDFAGRQKYFDEHFYNGREYEEYKDLVNEHLKKEDEFIQASLTDESIQEKLLDSYIDKAITSYIDTRDSNGTFPDFIGALFVGELDKCEELAQIRKQKKQEEYNKRREEAEKQRQQKEEEEKQAELAAMHEAERVFKDGGSIKDGDIIVKLADKYNINIPLRTKGWILNDLAECTITEDGGVSYRYWKRTKNSRGSQKAFDILYDIHKAICG